MNDDQKKTAGRSVALTLVVTVEVHVSGRRVSPAQIVRLCRARSQRTLGL